MARKVKKHLYLAVKVGNNPELKIFQGIEAIEEGFELLTSVRAIRDIEEVIDSHLRCRSYDEIVSALRLANPFQAMKEYRLLKQAA